MTIAGVIDRRTETDRRARSASFHYPERRTGFDRRVLPASARARLLGSYRRSPVLIAWCAVGILALSTADLLLTWRLIGLGAEEVNPVMARLFGGGLASAAVFKGAVTLAVSAGIWSLRRYRRVLEFSLVALALMAVLVVYEVAGLLLVSG